jgi:hypothetical protein
LLVQEVSGFFEHTAIREYYYQLRAAMIGARWVHLLCQLINEQTLPGIMSHITPWRMEEVGHTVKKAD